MGRSRTNGLLTALVGAGVVTALMRFNLVHGYGDRYFLTNMIGLLFVPMMYIFLVAREEPAHYGFAFGDTGRVWLFVVILFAGAIAVFLPASRLHGFQSFYPIVPATRQSLSGFVLFEVTFGLYLFCGEFFFRGFLLFGLQRAIGWPAVIVQAIAFGMMHYGNPMPELIVSFPTGIILGMLALRARSFFPCFVLHWASAVSFDLLVMSATH